MRESGTAWWTRNTSTSTPLIDHDIATRLGRRHALWVEPLVWHQEPPQKLRSPILVTAFEGWFDVGGAATGAVSAIRTSESDHLADIEPDAFFDFTRERPEIRIDHDGNRIVDWPKSSICCTAMPNHDRDLILIEGVEPHVRWGAFADSIVELAQRFDVAMVVTLGAMIAETPHTRPPVITGSTTDPRLAEILRLGQPSYQGPTGVVGVLHAQLEGSGIPTVSLRASVPHYVTGVSNPKASRALLERFERITGIPTRWSSLDDDAHDWEARVDEAMRDDDDVVAYVRRLEAQYDARTESAIPSPEDIAAEFQRYLEQHGDD